MSEINWKNTFNSEHKNWINLSSAKNKALESGYPYFLYKSLIYSTETSQILMTLTDLESYPIKKRFHFCSDYYGIVGYVNAYNSTEVFKHARKELLIDGAILDLTSVIKEEFEIEEVKKD